MNKTIQITEANKYSTKDITKWIRQTLKETYKDIKFSVTFESYAGGSSVSVTLLENNRTRILKTFEEITESDKLSIASARNDSLEEVEFFVKQQIDSTYNQVNQFHIETSWHYTNEGKKLLLDIMKIVNKYNHDNSDAMTDYFDVNYYVNLNLGYYDKPYKEMGK